MAELCLGTVQFGMKYGVNNQINRQPTWEESFEMLDYALTHGIRTIDTAGAYGEAELLLGEYFKNYRIPTDLRVISKLRPNIVEDGESDVEGVVKREIETSLKKMNLNSLDGYLMHTPEYIYNSNILDALIAVKEKGYVENIGISIYDLKEGYAALDTHMIDYIQLPYSILDQRASKEGFLKKAKAEGVKIYTRSAFLQGLFMMRYQDIPDHLQLAIPYLKEMDRVIEAYNIDKITAILSFVCSEEEIDYLVFGVETLGQLKDDIEKYRAMVIPKDCITELKRIINSVDNSIIFPSLWANGKKAE